MNDNTTINWNGYLYQGTAAPLIEQLRKTRDIYKRNNIENLPKNRYGISRISYYAGFVPWTNIPIANKNGGHI